MMARFWDETKRWVRDRLPASRRRRPVNPFTAPGKVGLDLVSPPPYDMSEETRNGLLEESEQLVERLLPGAFDAYNGDVLDGWADARARQIVAQLDAERDERMAIGEALIGLAREQLARREGRYLAAQARLREADEALEMARTRLAGSERPVVPAPRTERTPLRSSLGHIDLTPEWEKRPDPRLAVNGHKPDLPLPLQPDGR